ncbi:MAG TPA: hypothetical protein VD902_17365 [Symbiobacteriaceae bacterium]|nr:hypothetical protein [Symbiobacteriaceae bacterium]
MTDIRPQQPHDRDGAKFKPVHPEEATRKEELDRIRGMQDIQRHGTGPTHHTSNPSG